MHCIHYTQHPVQVAKLRPDSNCGFRIHLGCRLIVFLVVLFMKYVQIRYRLFFNCWVFFILEPERLLGACNPRSRGRMDSRTRGAPQVTYTDKRSLTRKILKSLIYFMFGKRFEMTHWYGAHDWTFQRL